MFQPLCFEDQKATFKTYDPRDLKTKDKDEPGTDLVIVVKGSNALLALIDPEMRDMFYTYVDQGEDTPLVEKTDIEKMTKLRAGGKFAEQKPKGVELIGANLSIDYGAKKDPLVFETCDLKDVHVSMFDGGTVHITFKAKTKATGDQVKKLHGLLGAEISFTVLPPGADQNHLPL